jgi:hypothetical protein
MKGRRCMNDPMNLSLREVRMMVDRILLQTDIVSGSQQAVRNAILGAEAMGLPALRHLDENFDAIRGIEPGKLSIVSEAPDSSFLLLDAGGEHAWGIAVPVLELAVDAARSAGAATVLVKNMREAEMLGGLAALAWGYRVDLQLRSGVDLALLDGAAAQAVAQIGQTDGLVALVLCDRSRESAASVRPDLADDPVMRRILDSGFPSTRDIWDRIYTRALGALTPDTVSSRRHAGTVMVGPDGKVIGRPDDDDTDFSLLSQPQLPATNRPAAVS